MAGAVSYGTTVTYDSVVIDDIKSVDYEGPERSFATRTPLSSQHALKLPGRVDAGRFSIELWYNETQHAAFWASLSSDLSGTTPPTAKTLVVVTPDGTTLTASTFVKSLAGPKADGEEALTATVVLEVNGAIAKS